MTNRTIHTLMYLLVLAMFAGGAIAQEAEAPDAPEELSVIEGVSIVRAAAPDADPQRDYTYHPDVLDLTSRQETLAALVWYTIPDAVELGDLSLLPDGKFDTTMFAEPAALVLAVEAIADVVLIYEDSARPGWALVVADEVRFAEATTDPDAPLGGCSTGLSNGALTMEITGDTPYGIAQYLAVHFGLAITDAMPDIETIDRLAVAVQVADLEDKPEDEVRVLIAERLIASLEESGLTLEPTETPIVVASAVPADAAPEGAERLVPAKLPMPTKAGKLSAAEGTYVSITRRPYATLTAETYSPGQHATTSRLELRMTTMEDICLYAFTEGVWLPTDNPLPLGLYDADVSIDPRKIEGDIDDAVAAALRAGLEEVLDVDIALADAQMPALSIVLIEGDSLSLPAAEPGEQRNVAGTVVDETWGVQFTAATLEDIATMLAGEAGLQVAVDIDAPADAAYTFFLPWQLFTATDRIVEFNAAMEQFGLEVTPSEVTIQAITFTPRTGDEAGPASE